MATAYLIMCKVCYSSSKKAADRTIEAIPLLPRRQHVERSQLLLLERYDIQLGNTLYEDPPIETAHDYRL